MQIFFHSIYFLLTKRGANISFKNQNIKAKNKKAGQTCLKAFLGLIKKNKKTYNLALNNSVQVRG